MGNMPREILRDAELHNATALSLFQEVRVLRDACTVKCDCP